MIKIPRYLKEFANDKKRTYIELYNRYKNPVSLEYIKKIDDIISYCQKGLIIPNEAILMIARGDL